MQNLLSTAKFPAGRAIQYHAARVSMPPNSSRIIPSAGRRTSYTFTHRREGQTYLSTQVLRNWGQCYKNGWFSISACIILHCWLECPAETFCEEERTKMNTESNLHFQIAGLGPTALKLWKEVITLRDENFVVVIFAMVLLSHSRVGRSKCICYALGCLSDNTGLFSCNWSTSMCCLSLSLPWKHSIW